MKIVTIGRSSSNDVNINDSQVSRVHCQIIQDDSGSFRLIDTNSRNGTYINGTKRHGEVILNTSDIVRIGNTTLPWQTYFSNVGSSGYDGSHTCVAPGDYGNSNNNSNRNSIHINYMGSGNPGNNVPPINKPNNYMTRAILCTIFCCLPFGIVSMVQASKVNGLWASGNYAEAQIAASRARTWFWWGFVLGLIFEIIYMIYIAVCMLAYGMV